MARALHRQAAEGPMARHSPARPVSAKDVMNTQLLSVRQDQTLPELATFLAEHDITGAPVIDDGGRFVGVVSVTDLAESGALGGEWQAGDRVESGARRGLHVEDGGRQVRDIMTPTVYTVTEDTPATQLARTMISGRVHRLFVTRHDGIIGIVTSLDLLRLLCEDKAGRAGD